MKASVCAYCERTISAKDMTAGRRVRSTFTGNNYCLREDCSTVGRRLFNARRKAQVES